MVAHPETPDSLASFTWNVTSLSAPGMALHATSSFEDECKSIQNPPVRRSSVGTARSATEAPSATSGSSCSAAPPHPPECMWAWVGRFGDSGQEELDLRSAAQVDKRNPTTTLAQVDQIDVPGSFVKIEQSGAVGAQATSLDSGRRRREQLEAQARTCTRRRGRGFAGRGRSSLSRDRSSLSRGLPG